MRKLILAICPNATALPPLFSPLPFSPSPYPSTLRNFDENLHENHHDFFYLLNSITIADSAFGLATFFVIAALLVLSLLSLSFIFHLRLKSRGSHHLQNFSSIWSVRLLLVTFVAFWALNEILRSPIFRRHSIYPFLPPLNLQQEANICKFYVVLSVGLFEPGILVNLLFLVNISTKKGSGNHVSAISTVGITCLPILLLQSLLVFFSPLGAQLPLIIYRTSFFTKDIAGNKLVMCTYPLFSCTVFMAFGMAYVLGFWLSCWRVLPFVINKCIRNRINLLAMTIMVGLPLQCLLLALSSFWTPENVEFRAVVLGMFICVALCSSIGEFILVIKPIVEALSAEGDFCRWNPGVRLRPEEVDSSQAAGEDRGQRQ